MSSSLVNFVFPNMLELVVVKALTAPAIFLTPLADYLLFGDFNACDLRGVASSSGVTLILQLPLILFL